MSDSPHDSQIELLPLALAGDESALAALFDGHREQLRRMIRLRLDRRLSGRVDSSDVLQEAFIDVRKRLAEYARDSGGDAVPPLAKEILSSMPGLKERL